MNRDTFLHSISVAGISLRIADGIGLSVKEKKLLYEAALFHDIGKCRIPSQILYKKEKLSSKEWDMMKRHPIFSEEIYLKMRAEVTEKEIVIAKSLRQHHENWDGSGYPDGLKGDETLLYARILRIADIFDAVTHPRVYRPFKVKNTLEMLSEMQGKEIDPQLYKQSQKQLEGLFWERFRENSENWEVE